MKYEQAVTFIMGKLIAAKIPPKREVDDAFVEDVRKSVLAENEATAASNAVKRANLGHLRKLIADREITFEKARSKFSEIKEEDLPDGTWGEFERGDEEIKPFAKAVFGVREGEMTGILEDDDNFYILKIAYVSPEKAGAEAIGVVQPEKRTVSRIAFRKSPPFIVQSREDLKKDLQSQMQIQAIEEYANTLLTNGQNKVVYPNGMH